VPGQIELADVDVSDKDGAWMHIDVESSYGLPFELMRDGDHRSLSHGTANPGPAGMPRSGKKTETAEY